MRKPISKLNMLSIDEYNRLVLDFNNTANDYPKDKCVHQLFEEQTIRTTNARNLISKLNVSPDNERNQVLSDFNKTTEIYPNDKCMHNIFGQQAEKTADTIAVIACDRTLTYRELNEEANRIAHSLIERGVKANDIVAFMLPRRSYLLSVMMGILKTGAAYLPIDPDYPEERISYMLEDSGTKLCITDETYSELVKNKRIDNPDVNFSPETPCYCIYTSGSTGKPKGTILTNRNVVNYCHNNNNNVVHSIIKEDYNTIVSVTTVGFDIFVTESLLPLANGLTIVLANEEQAKIQSSLNKLLLETPVDVLQTTPTKMKSLIADKTQTEYLKNLKAIILGGEALDSALVTQLQELTSASIFNIYGPTEATVWVTNTEIKRNLSDIYIYIYNYKEQSPDNLGGECSLRKPISSLNILSKQEYNKVTCGFNETATDYFKDNCIHEVFEEQAQTIPNSTAVIACDRTLTYRELNEEANRIAHSLMEHGVKPNDIVAFMLPRRSYLLSVMIGILKTGAAYLPIDTELPYERVDYMLKDSGVSFLIDSTNIDMLLNNEGIQNISMKICNENPCYCIYTSGSTGTPKAVVIKHRNLLNFCNNNPHNKQSIMINEGNAILSTFKSCFDAFAVDSMLFLLNGKTVVLADDENIANPEYLANIALKHNADVIHTTPSVISKLIENERYAEMLKHIKVITVAAEVFSEKIYKMIASHTKAIVLNGYGPSETTIGATYAQIESNIYIYIY